MRASAVASGVEFDVFLSYAHADRDLAEQLSGALEHAGFRVWQDDAQLTAGTHLEAAIRSAIDRSSHFVPLITDAWIASDYTNFEVEYFNEVMADSGDRKLVPVLRVSRSASTLGPKLLRLTSIDWSSPEEPIDSVLWQLYCALHGRDLGRREEWSMEGARVARGYRPGHGRIAVSGYPDELDPAMLRIRDVAWDGSEVEISAGLARVVLDSDASFFEETVCVEAGKLDVIGVRPVQILRQKRNPNGTNHRFVGMGPSGNVVVDVVWSYDRDDRARITAARIAHVAHRELGFTVWPQGWSDYKDKGDGSSDNFFRSNAVFHTADDAAHAIELSNALLRLDPPVRIDVRQGPLDPSRFGRNDRPAMPISVGHMVVTVVV